MKVCKRCLNEFDEDENIDYNPAMELGNILISDVGDNNIEDICPECREELRVMNLIGFFRP